MKAFLRKLIPDFLLGWYHLNLAHLANFVYGRPSQKLIMIGVTGTKGKTSTANFVWSVLNAGGLKTGLIGTANIRIGKNEMLNHYHMTMPSPFVIHKLLKQMADEGCTHVVMEATSEGLKLSRHVGIKFSAAVFTNLTPEHLPSHGGKFEQYKLEKAKLFQALTGDGEKIIVANADSEHAKYFLEFPADKKITYGLKEGEYRAENISDTNNGIDFTVKNQSYHLNILGQFNLYNALPAIALGTALKIPAEKIQQGIADLKTIPGRMERINEGQNFTVLVDYAHEAVSMNAALDAARVLAGQNKVIVLLGAEGGGRDTTKRGQMGRIAGQKADFVICSNVDPYDDDPQEIIHQIADGAVAAGKVIKENLFREPDRRKGIVKALSLAQPGDVILLTGKGAEQSMILGKQTISWDDRQVTREELIKLIQK